MFRNIFLFIFLIIAGLFTLGYLLYPIISVKNSIFSATVYTTKIDIKEVGVSESDNSISNLVNNQYSKYSQYVYYACIITSILIGGGVVLSFLRMKFISKILFILSQICMSIFTGFIIFIYYSPFIKNQIYSSVLPAGTQLPDSLESVSASYETGGILIVASYILMIVNYLLYSFIG
jgi:hypothetical protein